MEAPIEGEAKGDLSRPDLSGNPEGSVRRYRYARQESDKPVRACGPLQPPAWRDARPARCDGGPSLRDGSADSDRPAPDAAPPATAGEGVRPWHRASYGNAD